MADPTKKSVDDKSTSGGGITDEIPWDSVVINDSVKLSAEHIKEAAANIKGSPTIKNTSRLFDDDTQARIYKYLEDRVVEHLKFPNDSAAMTTLILGIMWRYQAVSTSRESKWTEKDNFVVKVKDTSYQIKDLDLVKWFHNSPHGGKVNPLRRWLRAYSPLWFEICQHTPQSRFDTTLAMKWGMPVEYACYSPDWFEPVDGMSDEAIEACRLKTQEAVRRAQTRGTQTSKVLNLGQLSQRAINKL